MIRRPLFAISLALACACGSSTQLAPTGPHPAHVQDFAVVDFPPPPAQIEEIPEALANAECAWIDGHYLWEERRFTWQPGRWVVPPAGCYFAPPALAWSRTGESRLYYTAPRWYREDAMSLRGQAALCPPPKTCAVR